MAMDGVEGDVDEGIEFYGDGGDACLDGLVKLGVLCCGLVWSTSKSRAVKVTN